MGTRSLIFALSLVFVPGGLFASVSADEPVAGAGELAQLQTRIERMADDLADGIDSISFGVSVAYRQRARDLLPDLYRMMDILDRDPAPLEEDAPRFEALGSNALLVARILAQERPADAVRLTKRLRRHLEGFAIDGLSDEEAEIARSEILASIDAVTAIHLAASGDREGARRLAERAWTLAPRFGGDSAAEDIVALGLDRLQLMLGEDPQRLVSEELKRAEFDRPWTIDSRADPRHGVPFDFTLQMPQPADVLRRLGLVEGLAQVLLAKHWRRMSFGCELLEPEDPAAFEAALDGGAPGSLRSEWRTAIEALGEAPAPPYFVHLKGLTLSLPAAAFEPDGQRRVLDDGGALADLLACGPLGRLLDPDRPCAPGRHCELPVHR